ncbi:MAG: Hsp20/alpha crystallin family protein [Candidatus Zixiibacteriota bacterium]|nr:MAG: Hsp20/alpha crystallin family protein [candidate division Zixibacteria bacterium]
MAIVRWKPMRELMSLRDEMDRMFDSFWGENDGRDGGMLMPPVDMIENDDNFVVSVELPGLKKDEIKMTMQNNVLTISGSKKHEFESKEDTVHRVERSYGSFCRSISLSSTIDSSAIKASYDSGVLKVTLPKVEEAKPKEIAIDIK